MKETIEIPKQLFCQVCGAAIPEENAPAVDRAWLQSAVSQSEAMQIRRIPWYAGVKPISEEAFRVLVREDVLPALQLYMNGKTAREICAQLGIDQNKFHRLLRSAERSLGCKSRYRLVAILRASKIPRLSPDEGESYYAEATREGAPQEQA